jgi:hypothetical protein
LPVTVPDPDNGRLDWELARSVTGGTVPGVAGPRPGWQQALVLWRLARANHRENFLAQTISVDLDHGRRLHQLGLGFSSR